MTWVRDAATTLGSIWNTYAITNVAVYFQAVSNFCPCRDSAITTMSLTGPVSPLEQLLQHKDDSFQVHLFSTKDLGSLAALNKSSQKLCHGQWALPGLAPWLWTWTMVGMDEFTIQPLWLQWLRCLSKRDLSIRKTPLCSLHFGQERTMKFITQSTNLLVKTPNYFFQA